MRKILVYSLQFTAVLSLFLTITYHLYPITSFAQEASPSSSLIQKLDELKKEIASKAAEIKTQVKEKVQNKAVIGSIISIEDGQIMVQKPDSIKTVNYDEFTEVIGLKDKKIEIDTLEEDDDIVALGDLDDKNNLVAQRIIFLQDYATGSAQLVWGQIVKTEGASITLKNRDNQEKKITTTTQTNFFLGNNEASLSDAKLEKYMITRGVTQKDGSIRARFIYFIPSSGFVKPSGKSASPSAEPEEN